MQHKAPWRKVTHKKIVRSYSKAGRWRLYLECGHYVDIPRSHDEHAKKKRCSVCYATNNANIESGAHA